MSSTVNHWAIEPFVATGANPIDIWKAALRYFEWCDNHPVQRPELMRNGPRTGETVYIQMPRPYTLAGLCLHCGLTYQYLREMAKNPDGGDYYMVAQKILLIVAAQKEEGALVGVFNAQFVSRDLRIGQENTYGKSTPVIQISVVADGAPPLLTNEQDSKGTQAEG